MHASHCDPNKTITTHSRISSPGLVSTFDPSAIEKKIREIKHPNETRNQKSLENVGHPIPPQQTEKFAKWNTQKEL